MEENLPGDLVVFALPEKRRGRLRTTKPQVSINLLEVVNGEIKRRASGKMFSSDGLLIRLVSAILMEISEEWETG
jgi:putative transposase